ncbi:sodium:solute symporter family transporter [Rossellomorea vietnamensis]|uniref:sodium:solute symporter family transporter n=1 Tax=Rossellomorea vietnamensis TaxID=218284 RepID=UPI003F4E1F7A
MMMIPGVIAFHLFGDSLRSVDLAYPTLIANILPSYLTGFFLAVLLGAVLSSFNSLLNSAATLFALDIYKPHFNKEANDQQLISVSKKFGILLAVISMSISPMLMNATEGLWDLIRRFTGFFNIQIVVILLVGVLSKRIPLLAAKTVIIFHVITYYMLVWGTNHLFGYELGINFIHIYGILFTIEVLMMIVIGKWKPLAKAYHYVADSKVAMTPWKYALPMSITLLASIAIAYVIFSPIGLAYSDGIVSAWFWPVIIGLVIAGGLLIAYALKHWNKKYAGYLERGHPKKELNPIKKPLTS